MIKFFYVGENELVLGVYVFLSEVLKVINLFVFLLFIDVVKFLRVVFFFFIFYCLNGCLVN